MTVSANLFLDVTGPSEHDASIAEASTRRRVAVCALGSERCISTQCADSVHGLVERLGAAALEVRAATAADEQRVSREDEAKLRVVEAHAAAC